MKGSKQVLSNSGKDYYLSDEDMGKLRAVELEILSDTYTACRKRDIPLYLTYGTLLGAVRHHGYIPWDDDIDIAAHYSDFPKIIEAVKEEFPGKYDFAGLPVDYKTNAFYGLKIMKKGTEAIEMPVENWPRPLGIFIDIFAIFKVSDNPKKRLKDFKRFDFWVHVGALAFEYRHKPKVVFELSAESKKYYRMRRLFGFICNPFYAHSRKALLKLYAKYDGQETGYYAVDYLAGMKGEAIPEKEITATSEYDFAGHKFTSFENYDFLLKLLYGSAYMELPPVEQRERHMMIKIKA